MTNQPRFFPRPRLWGLLCGLTLAVAQFFTGAGMGTAHAAPVCTTSGIVVTCTFAYTGAPETWTVPTNVTQATFDLYGAQGSTGISGGRGGRVTTTLSVTPNAHYQIRVGGAGASGGFNGGTDGGGGASDVRSGVFGLTDRLLVAGGGGGGFVNNGGAGGFPNGGAGQSGESGGGGGTQTGGGAGGTGRINGSAGSLGQGGNGIDIASGGGGGYYGGGGGAAPTSSFAIAGGGGGSSFGPTGATFENGVRFGDGLVILTYSLPDTIAPTANPTQSPASNASGWTTSQNVTVNWNWTDNGTVDATNCTTSSNSGSELGIITIEASCSDLADNLGVASYTLKIDPFAPLISRTRNPGPNGAGWNNSAVTVSFGCNDGNFSSGVASNTLGGATLSSEGANQAVTNTGSCVDVAGNVATPATVSPINIDLTKPTISAAATTAPNANGWYNNNVTIHYTCTDTLSGVVACPIDQGLSSEGTAVDSLALFSRDVADNVSDPSNVVTVKIDKTSPSVLVTGVTNGAVYDFGSVPTATCSTSDALAGVATQATVSISGGNGDGTGNFTATCSGATDVAGNSAAAVSVSYTVNPPADTTAPIITPNVVGTLGNNGWYVSDVSLSWSVVDAESAISSQSGCDPVTVNADTAGDTFTCSATSTGGTASQSVTIKRDATAPTISAAASSAPNANGWYNSDVTVPFTCNDNLSGVVSCPTDETLNSEGSAVSSTAQTITDQAGNSSAASNVVTVKIDKTAPVVTVSGVSDGASYTLGSVPAAACTTSDALSGVATQATVSVSGGNADGTGSFTATCSGASDNAGNSGSASVSYTVSALVDACTTTALRDNFNRANGGLGSNWAGLTGQSFYKIAGNQVDVQLGGPVVWKPTTFGVNQAAFVTLSTLDATAPSQGLLLKVQGGTIPTSGMIAVVYDNLAKAVRVSTLRLNTLAWTSYGNTPAVFANGDKLLGCVQANGTVRVYRNNSLLTTVTLSAADQSFFNTKGGRIGLWTVAASNLFVDDFGGGALTGVTAATLDANTVPDETADDGAEITVAENFPTDDTAAAPDAGTLVNRAFLPLVDR